MGFWWAEPSHPYFTFAEKGYEVEVLSLIGGSCEADAMSDAFDASSYSEPDLISAGWIAMPKLVTLVEQTKSVAELNVGESDASVVAGGQALMFTFEQ